MELSILAPELSIFGHRALSSSIEYVSGFRV
jgi:hypothetical protein